MNAARRQVRHRSPRLAALASLLAAWLALAAAPALAGEFHEFETSFGATGAEAGQLSGPKDVAVNDSTGDVYVADTGNRRVDEFSSTGTFIRAFGADVGGTGVNTCTASCMIGTAGTGPGQFTTPTFIAVDNSSGGGGDVYVADTAFSGSLTVQKFDPSGNLITAWGGSPAPGQQNGSGFSGGPFGLIAGIAVDSSGNLYVFKVASSRVIKLSQAGAFIETFSLSFTSSAAAGFAVDTAGNLFKADSFFGTPSSVSKYDSDQNSIGRPFFGTPTGLEVASSTNDLYVDSAGSSLQRFHFTAREEVLQPDGTSCEIREQSNGCSPTESFGSTQLTGTGAAGLAVNSAGGLASPAGNVYVAAAAANKIYLFKRLLLPDVVTGRGSKAGHTKITLNGTVNPVGLPLKAGPAEGCFFEYGEAGGAAGVYSHTAPCQEPDAAAVGSGTEPVEVHADLTGLQPGAVYHFRLVAANANGGAHGLDGTLGTVPPAGTPGARWQVTTRPWPTNFTPGQSDGEDGYALSVTNIGNAPQNSSALVFEDTLPEGLTIESVYVQPKGPETAIGKPLAEQLCTESATTLRCEWLPGRLVGIPGFQKKLPPIRPEQSVKIVIETVVPASPTEGPLTNTITASGGGGPAATASSTNQLSTATPPFGVETFGAEVVNADGTPAGMQAGSHPYNLVTAVHLNTTVFPFHGTRSVPGERAGVSPAKGDIRTITLALPPGLVGNPLAVPQCKPPVFEAFACPADTQIGNWGPEVGHDVGNFEAPIYNLEPQPGIAAELGFADVGNFFSRVSLDSGGGYGLRLATAGIPVETPVGEVQGLVAKIWGVPGAPAHDERRSPPGPSDKPETPFLSLPTQCSGEPLSVGVKVDSYQHPGVYSTAETALPPLTGCNQLHFDPTIEARPTTNLADNPSGLHVNLHVPQDLEDPKALATAHLRDAVVTLPKGLSLNPSAANGLAACGEAQVGYKPGTSAPNEFTPGPAECPDAAKLGKVEVDTPLLSNPLLGAVYLAEPDENPFGSFLAIYVVVDDPTSGIIVKLAGRVSADHQTGQLTASFEDSPQLPFEDFHLNFFQGAAGVMRTPATCGVYSTSSVLTPWSAPDSGPPAQSSDSFETVFGADGSTSCPRGASQEQNGPRFHAGTASPQAGVFSPFTLKIARDDGSQELSKIETTLPPGLAGRLAGVPYCPEAALAAAAASTGRAERSSPSCPAASEVGTVEVGAGAGPNPYHVSGHAYLAGPYRGAPLSLATLTPAVAGPFDLGTVLVRVALYVDPQTTQIRAVSDPLPTILEGIPLDVRSITLELSRPNFTLNPTNCGELGFTGSALSVLGQSSPLAQRFQLANCAALAFKPKLSLALAGSTKRAGNPALTATLTMPPGDANVASAQVTLPHAELLDNAHIGTTCSRTQFAAAGCPPSSVIGFARAETPLLEAPLEGPVYLMTGFGHRLPDVAADLNGQIRVLLHGKVDTGPGGGIRNTFEVVPDAPVSKFTLSLDGGGKGLLENSVPLCAGPQHATALFDGQNAKSVQLNPLLKVRCARRSKHRSARHHHKRASHRAAHRRARR